MRDLLIALARRGLRRAGYELRPLTGAAATEPVPFATPIDAIYSHGDPVFEVPIDRCFYPYVFSYAGDGWHPFVQTLRELLANEALDYRDSALHRYYALFRPQTVRHALFEEGADSTGCEALDAFPIDRFLPVLPWDPAPVAIRGEKGLAASHGHQGYGPVSDEKGELEFRRLATTLRSIRARGYRPEAHADGEIRGYFLKMEGDYRFVVRSGLHRTAALAALGHRRLRVALFGRYPRAVHLCDIGSWPPVREGLFDRSAAERYFRRFFRENGRLKAERLGLLPAGQSRTGSGGGHR